MNMFAGMTGNRAVARPHQPAGKSKPHILRREGEWMAQWHSDTTANRVEAAAIFVTRYNRWGAPNLRHIQKASA